MRSTADLDVKVQDLFGQRTGQCKHSYGANQINS